MATPQERVKLRICTGTLDHKHSLVLYSGECCPVCFEMTRRFLVEAALKAKL